MRDRALAAAGVALSALLMLCLLNRANLAWPKQTHMYLSMLTLAVAFRATARPGPARMGRALEVCAALAIATFSFGYGIVGFVPVVLVAAQRRWRPIVLCTVPATFAACLALYAAISAHVGYGLGAFAHEATPSLRAIVAMGSFALAFVAAPAVDTCRAFMPAGSALLVGEVVTAVLALPLASRVLRAFRHPPDELDAWAILLSVFTLGNAVETALVRSARFGIEGALEYRYVLGELPFWLAVLLLALRAGRAARPPVLLAAGVAALGLVGALFPSTRYELHNLRDLSPIRWQAAMSALDGVPDRKLYGDYIWPDAPDQVVAVVDGLRARHWSVFDWPEANWIGRNVATLGRVVTGCAGRLETVAPVTGGGGVEVDGWLLDRHVAPGWGWVAITDAAGVVRGVGHGGVPRNDILFHHPSDPVRFAGWRGYVAGAPVAAGLAAWLVEPGRRVCRLGAGEP